MSSSGFPPSTWADRDSRVARWMTEVTEAAEIDAILEAEVAALKQDLAEEWAHAAKLRSLGDARGAHQTARKASELAARLREIEAEWKRSRGSAGDEEAGG